MKVSHKQRGLALLVLVFILALVTIGFAVRSLDSSTIENERNKKTAAALAEAKAALVGWSVAHPQYPGIFPFPDRNADGNYDGNSDCMNGTPSFGLLIGKLPYVTQTMPCIGTGASQYGLSADLIDGHDERLWYAVSRNLIRTSTAVGSLIVNPSIADAPGEAWLVVRDKNGAIISDRVAAVIISPGTPIGGQDRSGGLAGASAYLDSVTISGTTYSNANYSIANEVFFIGDDMQYVSSTNPTYQQPYQYNDKLIYITIDELMLALEKRAVREAANNLKAYYVASSITPANRFYPYAAALIDDVNNLCVEGLNAGGLPLDNAASGCTHPNAGLSALPSWFTESGWEDYMYYVISNDCNFATPGCILGDITVGIQTNVDALLISSGAEIPALTQARPSSSPGDYLDSTENADGDSVFDTVGTLLTNTYNDQMLIVAP